MGSFRITRVFGVDVMGDGSLVALGALLTWVIYLELRLPASEISSRSALLGAGVGGALFLATILAHEVSHTWMALRRGLAVKEIRLFIFGGASELKTEAPTPQIELMVAIVGPLVSAALGGLLIAGGAIIAGPESLARSLRFVGVANIALAVFNLLPGLPLDGGRVMRAVLWRRTGDKDRATETALRSGRVVGLVLIGLGASLALRSTGAIGLWVAIVGWYLARMAAGAGRQHRLDVATRGRTVGNSMRTVSQSIRSDLTVADAVELHQMGPRLRTLVVAVDGRIVGLFGQREVDRIDPDRLGTATVGDAMTRIGPADVVDVATPLVEALRREAGATRHIVATDSGRVVGLIGALELAQILEL